MGISRQKVRDSGQVPLIESYAQEEPVGKREKEPKEGADHRAAGEDKPETQNR